MRKFMSILATLLCIAILVVSVTCFRIVYAYGESMEPTYSSGDLLMVMRYFDEPEVGDVVLVFHEENESPWIKRVAAVAGDTVYNVDIPEGYVYILGDNANDSYDSREVGPIPVDTCWGKVIWTFKENG